MPEESRVFGPPGTGKTTFLARQVAKAKEAFKNASIMLASFTKTAAAVMGQRVDLPKGSIGTLHSFAYHAIGRPEMATDDNIDDFNEQYPHYRMTPPKSNLDEGQADAFYDNENDRLFSEYQRQRALMADKSIWPIEVLGFADAWDTWKAHADLYDFTDLIEAALATKTPPPNGATIGFFDETQDFTRMELALVRHWGAQMTNFILAGDDDQCHPAGTLIRTSNRGDVPIEALGSGDLLCSYDRKGGAEIYRKGYKWTRSIRCYSGNSCTFTVGDRILETTHDHRMMVRWRNNAVGAVAVYLQQRGECFRVGTTEVVRSQSGMFGPTQRARQEDADHMWILEIFDDPFMARLCEEYVSVMYGIPKAVFKSEKQAIMDRHHITLISAARIDQLLLDQNLDRAHPFWSKSEGQRGRGCKSWQIVRACNCFEYYMEMATDVGERKPQPVAIEMIDREMKNIIVYSLNVEPYHTYIASGIVTPNCIFGFKGATPDAFLDTSIPDTHKRVLSQSYRVPRAVHTVANRIVGELTAREPKDYAPRDAEGSVETIPANFQYPDPMIDHIEEDLAEGRSVMILASCAYMLKPTVAALRSKALPFHNPYKRNRGDWNPLRTHGTSTTSRLMSYMKPRPWVEGGRDMQWIGMDIQKWIPLIASKGVLKRGAKTTIANILEETQRRHIDNDQLRVWFEPGIVEAPNFGTLDWLEQHTLAAKAHALDYPIAILGARGPDALMDQPKITVGTIHSVKGGEADSVYIFPDLSNAGMSEYLNAATRDRAIRQFYVGVTRARERLIVAAPLGSAQFDLGVMT